MSKLQFWQEFIAESFEEHGVNATPEQILAIGSDAMLIAESFSEFSYQPAHPAIRELEETKVKLKAEQDKVICRECSGRGFICSQGPYHGSTSTCFKCNGNGKVKP